jgi:hypothetical protein
MPRLLAPLLALGLGASMTLALAACGGEDAQLLPGETAREITANLDSVAQLAGEGDCIGAEGAAQQVGEQIEALEGVDRKLKRNLEEGAARLNEVIAGCEETATEAIAPATVPTEAEGAEKPAKEDKGKAGKAGPKEETPSEAAPPPPPLPPQAKGEGKGLEEGSVPPAEEGAEESPSGGVGPGNPAGEGE